MASLNGLTHTWLECKVGRLDMGELTRLLDCGQQLFHGWKIFAKYIKTTRRANHVIQPPLFVFKLGFPELAIKGVRWGGFEESLVGRFSKHKDLRGSRST